MVKARKKLYLEHDEVEVPRNRRPAAARVQLPYPVVGWWRLRSTRGGVARKAVGRSSEEKAAAMALEALLPKKARRCADYLASRRSKKRCPCPCHTWPPPVDHGSSPAIMRDKTKGNIAGFRSNQGSYRRLGLLQRFNRNRPSP